MLCVGIDAGSRAIKIAFLDSDSGQVIAVGFAEQGVAQAELAGQLLARLLDEQGYTRADIAASVATGYGRYNIRFAERTVTEITCHAVGVTHYASDARTVVEIGGQDSKVLHLDEGGVVRDFAMNDRCAAGSGRFLETVAARLDMPFEKVDNMVLHDAVPVMLNSTCVVFAETEIIGLLATGARPADLFAGVDAAIARRIAAMAGTITPPVIFTGGVALVPGMDRALSDALGTPVTVSPHPQYTGAIGAALLAYRQQQDKISPVAPVSVTRG